MLIKRKSLEKGDTIVEVLVVLAVLGLALSVAYATANRSLLNARQAQENAEATELVQQQIEEVRFWAPSGTTDSALGGIYLLSTNVFSQSDFCVTALSGSNPFTPYTTPADCNFPAGGMYNVQVHNCDKSLSTYCTGISNTSDTFVIRAQWPDVIGQGTDSVTQAYRVHPQS